MPTIEQIRAARALLGWNQHDLADKAGLSQTGIARIENGTNQPNSKTLEKIGNAFDHADIEFLGTSGLRKKTGEIRTLRGSEGFRDFIYDVYETVRTEGGEVCVSNVDERLFDKWQGPYREDYLDKMSKLRTKQEFVFKILIKSGDDHRVADYAEYKSLQEEHFGYVPFYVYGEKTAIILFKEDDVTIYIINNKDIAYAQRQQFSIAWSSATN